MGLLKRSLDLYERSRPTRAAGRPAPLRQRPHRNERRPAPPVRAGPRDRAVARRPDGDRLRRAGLRAFPARLCRRRARRRTPSDRRSRRSLERDERARPWRNRPRSHHRPPHARDRARAGGGRVDGDHLGGHRACRPRRDRRRSVVARGRPPRGRGAPLVPLQHHYVVTDPIGRSGSARRSCRSSAIRTTPSTPVRRRRACSSAPSSATRRPGRWMASPTISTPCCSRPTSSRSRTASWPPPGASRSSVTSASRPSSTDRTATRPTASA